MKSGKAGDSFLKHRLRKFPAKMKGWDFSLKTILKTNGKNSPPTTTLPKPLDLSSHCVFEGRFENGNMVSVTLYPAFLSHFIIIRFGEHEAVLDFLWLLEFSRKYNH